MRQYSRVKSVLTSAGAAMALHQIREAILQRFGKMDSETAISARIREIRRDLEDTNQGTVVGQRIEGKSHHAYRLSLTAVMQG